MSYNTVLPAYGRDYTSAKAVKEAWERGDDFKDARTGLYMSKRDVANEPADVHIEVRYAKLRKVVIVR